MMNSFEYIQATKFDTENNVEYIVNLLLNINVNKSFETEEMVVHIYPVSISSKIYDSSVISKFNGREVVKFNLKLFHKKGSERAVFATK